MLGTRSLNDQLEEFVDDCSLADVLIALSEICSEKGKPLSKDARENVETRDWRRCAVHVDAVASVAYRLGL